ncbi:thiolase family protein [Pseudoteredinibacter isoporae]|uniref:propanoyl-CoA C-acyltransferase n=1 Tax=Pseudoteredinibacter isoporae TaxID=570281 RepID=A0A7X0JRP4_9GAMM|nr:thiolase family protein [Pseudoteredinibacter isoporae]MBB6520544.1 acetyl-CoA acetyltransferase [Pseudoteredinibacter isoporae]NHO86111.1 thiolase family protein [Pseudoteredinibacter isoporae]NIB25438.1 thiolase family protein [Pseudoteredinibacter isoporae]
MNDIVIAGIGMTGLGKMPERSVKDLSAEAVRLALKDACADVQDIEAAWFSNTRQQMLEGQNTIRGQIALHPLGFESIPICNVENACASGSTALYQAVTHIRAGMAEMVLVLGAEKMFFPEKREAMFRAFMGGTDIYRLEEFSAAIEQTAVDLIPEELRNIDTGQRSFFMDSYAAQARLHMKTFGTTQKQLAMAAAKNHWHSTMNPLAQYQHDMSTEDVLNGRLISWPFTLPMCAPISDGAACAVVCSSSALAKLEKRGYQRQRAIRIRGIHLASGQNRAADDFANHIGRIAALGAYEEAGIEGHDIDVAEVHDATAYAEIQQIENLGLCEIGAGGAFTEAGDSKLGGKVPVNPSGGLVSKGHPVGATGIMQLQELCTQLRGEADKRQVENPRIAVAENGGGFYENEEAATVVTVLERQP